MAGAIAFVIASGHGPAEKVDFEVIQTPVPAPAVDLSQQPKPKPPEEKPPPLHKVFGVSKKAITEESGAAKVEVKAGNTLATAPDNEKLKPGDAESLPIPTDEYLVSRMPSVVADVRIPYPPEAKAHKIEGKVVMELLIDADGKVRQAKIISGPGYGLEEAALAAITRFKFRPAEVDGKPVAVKIPFTYNFLLKSE